MYEFGTRSRENSIINYEEALANGKRSYNFQNMQRSTHFSQTDKRIQQIKRKYDTPNRRQRITQLSSKKNDSINKENENYCTADFKTKSFIYPGSQTTQKDLRQSKAPTSVGIKHNYYNNSTNANMSNNSSLSKKVIKENETTTYDQKSTFGKIYKNQNEEEFFKRVKQMKQSLLYGGANQNKTNEGKTSANILCNKQSRVKNSMYDTNEKDRIDNIDKINQKIRSILDCLNDNEKTKLPTKLGDNKKRIKAQVVGTVSQQPDTIRDTSKLSQTNQMTSSMIPTSVMGRQSFGNHRYQRSQLLQRIEIKKSFKDERTTKARQDEEDKWEKLSNKLQKYEFDTKMRLQKALQSSKQLQNQIPQTKPLQNSRNNRSVYQPRVQQEQFKPRQRQIPPKRDNRSVDFKQLRSRSYISPLTATKVNEPRDKSLNRPDFTEQRQYEMRNGRKLDDQISKIQKKIQQFEEEKKRLNINFKPFTYSNTKSTSNLGINNNNKEEEYQEKKVSQFTNGLYCKNPPQQSKQSGKRNYMADRQQKSENESTFRERKQTLRNQYNNEMSYQNRLDSKIQIKIQHSNPSSVRTSKFISNSRTSNFKDDQEESYAVQHETKEEIILKSQQNSFSYIYDESIQRKTDEGILERKKRLQSVRDIKPSNNQLKQFVEALCEQVTIDEDFRNAKIWYDYSDNPKKEQQIRQLIPSKNAQEIRQILKVRQSQNNPFFTIQGCQSSLTKLAQLYKRSQTHWSQKLHKRFNKGQLQSQGFTSKQIDLQKKNHINLGDLVRFLNLESGTFYRNRDLALIFIRICKLKKSTSFTEIDYQWLVSAFTK